MSVGHYLVGLLVLGTITAGFGVSARFLRLRLLPRWQGAPAVLATVVLALSVAVVTSEALGLIGLLDTAAIAIAAVCFALGLVRWLEPKTVGSQAQAKPNSRLAFALATGAALLTAVHWAGPVLNSLDVGMYRQDSTWYHLPQAAWFAQTGSVGGLLVTDPLKLAVWYYPANSELLHAIGMVVFGNDLISPVLNFGWMGIALLASWCVGRPFGLAGATLLGAILVIGSDMMLVQAGNAPSDIAALACLVAAIAILVNGQAAHHAGGRPRSAMDKGLSLDRGALAVAALAAGLAIGTKVTMLAPVSMISIGLVATAGREKRMQTAAIWLGGLLVTGGFWYLRNIAHSGNPLPWIHLGPLSGPSQEDLYPRPAHSIAEYIANRHAWTDFFLPGFGETLGPLWFVVLFTALAGIVLGLRRRHGALIRIVALAAAATLIAHVFNPISASGPTEGPYGFASNLRYAAPGFALGLILLPLCESRWIVRRLIVPIYALTIAVTAIGSAEWIQPQPLAAIAIGAAAVLVPIWLLRKRPTVRGRIAIAALAAAAILAGYVQQHQYFHDRYLSDVAPALDNPGFRATSQWGLIQTWAREQHGLRIGIVGPPAAYGQYVFYGSDLSNEVRYLGEPQPRGGMTQIGSCRRWRRIVDAGHFDAIVVTPEEADSRLVPQISWTEGEAARPLLRVYPAGVYTLSGPLKPSACTQVHELVGPPGNPDNPYLHPGASSAPFPGAARQ